LDEQRKVAFYKREFPNGFPKSVEEMTVRQRGLIFAYGATLILYYLGIVKTLNRSMRAEVKEFINKLYEDDNLLRLYAELEKEAMICIDDLVIREEPEKIILIFGAIHDFSMDCTKHGYAYEKIDTAPFARKNSEEIGLVRKAVESIEVSRSSRGSKCIR
jgi:hypothetical protein